MFSSFKTDGARGVAREGFALDFEIGAAFKPPVAAANGRSVERIERAGKLPVVVKRWTTAWTPWISYRLYARREFDNLVALERSGVPVARPLACYWSPFDAGLVTESIEGAATARERPDGIWEALAAVLGKAIDAGLDHPDLHLGNILVRGGDVPQAPPEVFLVDLQEARVASPTREAALRTLGFLMHSIVEYIPTTSRVRFLKALRDRSQLLSRIEWRSVARGVEAEFRRARAQYFRDRVDRVKGESSATVVQGAWVMSRERPLDAGLRAKAEACDALEPIKAVEGRAVYRLESFFVKSTRPSWLGSGPGPRAWRGAWGLKLRRLPVAEPRGLFRGKGRDVLVTDWIEGTPLPEYVESKFGAWPRERQLDFLRSLAALVRRMHARGAVHGDLKGGNILVTPAGFVLVDLDRVEFFDEVPEEARVQNLAQLVASVAGAVTKADRWRFLGFYAGRDKDLWRLRKLHAREVLVRAVARQHRWPTDSSGPAISRR